MIEVAFGGACVCSNDGSASNFVDVTAAFGSGAMISGYSEC